MNTCRRSIAIASAVRVATEEIRHDINHIIEREIAQANERTAANTTARQTASA